MSDAAAVAAKRRGAGEPPPMKRALLMLLALGAVALAVLGYRAANARAKTSVSMGATAQTLWLASLREDIARASRVTISRGEQRIELARGGAEGPTWVLPGKDGFAATESKVVEVLRGLAEARVVETKTANPELFARLHLNDPLLKSGATSDEQGSLVTIADAQGATLAAVILGKRHEAANSDPTKAGTFVREAGKDQSYLIDKTFTFSMDEMEWFNRAVTSFDGGRFVRLLVQHPAGAVAVNAAVGEEVRYAREPGGLVLVEGLAPEEKLADLSAPQRTLETLASLSVDDVRRKENLEMRAGDIVTATWTTSDGVTITGQSVVVDGKTWLHLRASFAPPAEETPVADPAQAAKDAEVKKAMQEAIGKEIAALDARLSPWVFAVNDGVSKGLRATRAALLAPASGQTPGQQTIPLQVPEGLVVPPK